MSLLGNTQDIGTQDIAGADTDTLGGSLFESDIYQMEIKMAYLLESKNGALGMYLEFADKDGKTFRMTEYFTNRNKQNFYERDGKKSFLPGFLKINSLCQIVTGKSFVNLESEFEDRVVNVYNADAKREVPTTVKVLVPLLKEGIRLGLLKVRANKQEKDTASGEYVDTAEDRVFNQLDKYFSFEDAKTSGEIEEDMDATFFEKWLAKHQGKLVDRYKEPKQQGKGMPGRAAPASSTASGPAPAKKSLFDK